MVIRSNEIEVDVREANVVSQDYLAAQAMLTHRKHARLLYHRLLRDATARHVDALEAFAKSQAVGSSGSIQYALARALCEHPAGARRNSRRRRIDLLSRALDSGSLGRQQRVHAATLLDRLHAQPGPGATTAS
jgi:hypothetical protein